MRWLKRNLLKIGIAIPSMLLPLALMVWVPVLAAEPHEGIGGSTPRASVSLQVLMPTYTYGSEPHLVCSLALSQKSRERLGKGSKKMCAETEKSRS